MNVDQIKTVHYSRPFQSLSLFLADGRAIEVRHRDFMSYSPSGRTAIVHHADETFSLVDIRMVTEVRVHPAAAAQARTN